MKSFQRSDDTYKYDNYMKTKRLQGVPVWGVKVKREWYVFWVIIQDTTYVHPHQWKALATTF